MRTRKIGLAVADGSIGGRDEQAFHVMKCTAVLFVVLAVTLYVQPAHAAVWDPLLDFLDETTLAFKAVVGGFILLVGLISAWIVAWATKSPGMGFVVAACVIGFAGMVAQSETIASELGFGGG